MSYVVGIHRLVKQIKGRSSRLLRQEFPSLRRRLPTLWTNSYFVATVGGATLEVARHYVETSGTSECRPLLPMAEARAFPGGSR